MVNKMVVDVDCGGGAHMTAPDELEWHLRYGDPEEVRYMAASVVASFDYLIRECTRDEAWRRLKLMRSALSPDARCRQLAGQADALSAREEERS